MPTVSLICLLSVIVTAILGLSDGGSLPAISDRADSVLQCPDKLLCAANSTCCMGSEGQYSCCAYNNAVCCDDRRHCCPQNSICTVGGCMARKSGVIDSLRLTKPAVQEIVEKESKPLASELSVATSDVSTNSAIVICPDPTRSCPDYTTCCLMPNHQWVCCPLPMAACCPDGFHCCPYGSRCDPSSTRCFRGDEEDSSALFFIQSILSHRRNNKKLL